MPLIEFTHAYTAALRLELNLLGHAKPLAEDAGRPAGQILSVGR